MASKTPIKVGGTAPGSTTDDVPKILREAIGLPLQVIAGYKGTADIRLAADSGELAGGCWAWESIKVTWRKALESGDVNIVLQAIPKSHPELSSIPLAINFAKTEEARTLIQVGIHDQVAITRPYVLPPGTPKDRVRLMRQAFVDTLKDKDFLAEAEKSKLDLDPLTGEELEAKVSGLFKLNPALVAKLKEALK
jgi:tripartite-type tricarboxylate transporter receptor subunit TctC